jgi:hypothetical protein
MIFVFDENGNVDVVERREEACKKYPGRDVDSGCFVFYDDDGNYLRPDFTVPNKRNRLLNFFGITSLDKDGIYDLKPDPQAKEDPMWLMLYESSRLNPNNYFRTFEEAKAHLRSKGVVVDQPPSPE